MSKRKIVLPSVVTEDVWFYEENKKVLEPHLGKPYISYSTASGWLNPMYRPDMIKQKFAGIELSAGLYAEFGTYVGEGVENGKLDENNKSFKGQEFFELIPRPEGAEYERFVLIDFGTFIFIGFIDIYVESEQGVTVTDLKTGGKNKEKEYMSPDYTQVPLYATALENEGKTILDTNVWFVRRGGSHISPPLSLTADQFKIDIKYDKSVSKNAVSKLEKAVKEISDHYKTFIKVFGS